MNPTLIDILPRIKVKFDEFGFAKEAIITTPDGKTINLSEAGNLRSVSSYVKGSNLPTVTLEFDAFPEFSVEDDDDHSTTLQG